MAIIYFHVAGKQWRKGEPLYSWDILSEMGEEPDWKWDAEPGAFDYDVVCLFDNLRDAAEFWDEFGGTVLQIWLPKWFVDGESYSWYDNWTRRRIQSKFGGPNVEGYYFVRDAIPADWIHSIGKGTVERALKR